MFYGECCKTPFYQRLSRDFRYQSPPLFSRALKRSGRLGTRLNCKYSTGSLPTPYFTMLLGVDVLYIVGDVQCTCSIILGQISTTIPASFHDFKLFLWQDDVFQTGKSSCVHSMSHGVCSCFTTNVWPVRPCCVTCTYKYLVLLPSGNYRVPTDAQGKRTANQRRL